MELPELPDYPEDSEADRAARRRSREAAKRLLADPAERARIEAAMAELDSRPPPDRLMTGDEFLRSVGFDPSAP